MPKAWGPSIASRLHSFSHAASSIVCCIPQLLARLNELENGEARLDARARQLAECLPEIRDGPLNLSHPSLTTSTSRFLGQAKVDGRSSTTLARIDPGNVETPTKRFLSSTLAMSVRNKRRGRVFLAGDSTEFGERR